MKLLGADIPLHWPDDHDARFLRLRLEQMRQEPEVQQWLARAMVLRNTRRVVGSIGFHGPPDERASLEVGYSVFPEHRRQGYASEAVLALLSWAAARHGIKRFVASVSPSNDASLALVGKLGFRQMGKQWDEEDGEELVLELLVDRTSRIYRSDG